MFCFSVFTFVHFCGYKVLQNSTTVSFVGILNKNDLPEQFLDDYEISRLVCDSDDSEDDRTQR
jgi:hypothetical protein